MIRAGLGVVVVLAVAGLAAPGPRAADFEFLPEYELALRHDGNVAVTGEEQISDQALQLTVELNLSARTRRTVFDLSFRPYREVYLDFGELDNSGIFMSSQLRHELSRRADFRLALSVASTERQSVIADAPGDPTTLVPRTRIDRANLALTGRFGAGQRSFVTWDLGASRQNFDSGLQDSTTTLAGLGWGHQVRPRIAVGIQYRFQAFSFDTLPGSEASAVHLFVERPAGARFTATLHVGGFRLEDATTSFTEPAVELVFDRELRNGNLALGLRQAPSGGNGLGGASRDRGGYVDWLYRRPRRWGLSVLAAYWQRVTLSSPMALAAEQTTRTGTLTANRWLGARLSIGASLTYLDQESAIGLLSTSHTTGSIFLRWSPLER